MFYSPISNLYMYTILRPENKGLFSITILRLLMHSKDLSGGAVRKTTNLTKSEITMSGVFSLTKL